MRPRLSLVIPVFNEAASLTELVRRCLAVCDEIDPSSEIVLVDDGSADASRDLIREASWRHRGRVFGVLLNRNYGQHAAVMAGLECSRGDVVVTLDADLQNPPEEIPKLLEAIDDGCDVVGSRRIARDDHWLRRGASKLVNRAVRAATGVAMNDYGCMLRAYRRPIVEALLRCPERSTFIPILANSFAGRTAEVEVEHARRDHQGSRYSLWKLINLQFDLLTSMTTFPLRLLSLVGGALSVLGFGFAVGLLVLRFVYGAPWAGDGVFTVLAALFFLVGVQLLGMGMLGEYIGRIYADVRGRPRYHVQEHIGTAVTGTQDTTPLIRPLAASGGRLD